MGDYIAHWLKIGETEGAQLPKIFYVNWFRKDERGNFMWPGFGENSRVLEWVCRRLNGEVEAIETPLGFVPHAGDLNLDGLKIDAAVLEKLLTVDTELVKSELPQVKEFLAKLGERLPEEMNEQLAALEAKLG
jgi:phosphoenolpyruvate carboxykinase (GTP)